MLFHICGFLKSNLETVGIIYGVQIRHFEVLIATANSATFNV